MIGNEIHNLAKKLWPINRSLTGDGVRDTLAILKSICNRMTIHEVPTATKVFDWEVPKEWRVKEAYVITPDGEKILDFATNNLHLLGYSTPIEAEIDLEELEQHLYSLPDQPDAIPYITSYYKERWGFCITHNQRQKLKKGKYKILINSELFNGSLTYGEILLPGKSNKEVFLSTYVCHPSMANNELSGPCVSIYLAKWIESVLDREYSYRIVFIPETIGSITYLSKNLLEMKQNIFAGFNITCIGDERGYSYLPSRHGNTISDIIAKHVLRWTDPNFIEYTWSDRGSDERQYCAPGIDLPIVSIMKTKYAQYPEYHTSLDDLENVVTPKGLNDGYNILKLAIEALENNCIIKTSVLCEPQLGKRGLYPTVSTKEANKAVRTMMDLISFADGNLSLLEIADRCKTPIWNLYEIVEKLVAHEILVKRSCA